MIVSSQPASHAGDAAAGAVAHRDAGEDRQGRRGRVAQQVGDRRAGQRRDPGDRQRLEPVEDALVHVLAELDAGRHAGGQRGLGEDARDDDRQVVRHAAGDRAAEDVGEHRREQQRLDRDVEELLRVAAHLLRGPPGHGQALADGVAERTAARRRSRAPTWVVAVTVSSTAGESSVIGPASFWVSSSAPWPVRAMKTSSRVGFWTVADVISSSCSRRPISTSAARLASGSGTLMPPASGVSTGSSPTTRRTTSTAWAGLRRVEQPQLQGRGADLGLELVGGALGDLDAAVDDRDPVGELVGLVEVLRGQQHRAALGDQVADGVPHLAAGARVEAGGRLVEEDQRRPGDQAGGQVEPAPHATGELRDLLVAGVLEAEPAEQLLGGRARPLLVDAEQPAEQVEVLAGGEVLVDRGVLPGDADQLAHHVRVLLDVDAEDLRAAAVHREQRGEHLEHRGLAGAVGSEDAEDLAAAYLQVDAVDGPQVAEGLHEAVGSDCQLGRGGGVRVHDHDSG